MAVSIYNPRSVYRILLRILSKHQHVFSNACIYFHIRKISKQIIIPDRPTEIDMSIKNIIHSQVMSNASIKSIIRRSGEHIGGAENAGVENAGVETTGEDSRSGNCRSGRSRSR